MVTVRVRGDSGLIPAWANENGGFEEGEIYFQELPIQSTIAHNTFQLEEPRDTGSTSVGRYFVLSKEEFEPRGETFSCGGLFIEISLFQNQAHCNKCYQNGRNSYKTPP